MMIKGSDVRSFKQKNQVIKPEDSAHVLPSERSSYIGAYCLGSFLLLYLFLLKEYYIFLL